jgi:hypothetical protein
MGFNKLSSVKDPLSHRVFPIPRNLSFVNFISLRTIIKDSERFWRVRIVHRICEFFAFFPQKQNFHKRGHRKQKAKSKKQLWRAFKATKMTLKKFVEKNRVNKNLCFYCFRLSEKSKYETGMVQVSSQFSNSQKQQKHKNKQINLKVA